MYTTFGTIPNHHVHMRAWAWVPRLMDKYALGMVEGYGIYWDVVSTASYPSCCISLVSQLGRSRARREGAGDTCECAC